MGVGVLYQTHLVSNFSISDPVIATWFTCTEEQITLERWMYGRYLIQNQWIQLCYVQEDKHVNIALINLDRGRVGSVDRLLDALYYSDLSHQLEWSISCT